MRVCVCVEDAGRPRITRSALIELDAIYRIVSLSNAIGMLLCRMSHPLALPLLSVGHRKLPCNLNEYSLDGGRRIAAYINSVGVKYPRSERTPAEQESHGNVRRIAP